MAVTDRAAGRPPADRLARRVLRVEGEPRARAADAQRMLSTSIFVSAVRCLLTYLVLPFVAPAVGFASGVGPAVGIVIGVAAIAANVVTVRRFWRADHRWRWRYTWFATAIVVLLLVLLVGDVVALVS